MKYNLLFRIMYTTAAFCFSVSKNVNDATLQACADHDYSATADVPTDHQEHF